MNSLPKTVTRQRRDCDLNLGPSAPESSTLTTRLLSHLNDGVYYLLCRWHCQHSMRNRVYVTVRRLSVRLSVQARWARLVLV